MPSSDYNMIPKVLDVVTSIRPKSILDIGVGNGRYGFLFRECLDWNYARFRRDLWETEIDGIEVNGTYVNAIHHWAYDAIIRSDWLEWESDKRYELAFMGDVLEHFQEGKWQQALLKARKQSCMTLVVSPNWKGSVAQGVWHGQESEVHHVVLSPQKVGGKCIYANSKMFMCGFDNIDSGAFDERDLCK